MNDDAWAAISREPNDEFLADLVADGDVGALSQLIVRHASGIELRALNILRDQALAEDVSWEVFEWVWERRRTLHCRNVRSFLLSKAASLALHRLRSEYARRERQTRWACDSPSHPQTPDAVCEDAQLSSDLGSAIDTLPPRQRQAFVLRKIEGLTCKVAGEIMGLSPRTIEHYVEHATTKLRSQLQQHATERTSLPTSSETVMIPESASQEGES